tara:strand:+ start:415 stop:603 length:189 start_codon:yes stop_codon:yes gene_type:complete
VNLLVDGLYTVVLGDSLPDLISKVNYLMEEGWQPQGGLLKEGNRDFYQAMVRPLIVNQALVV